MRFERFGLRFERFGLRFERFGLRFEKFGRGSGEVWKRFGTGKMSQSNAKRDFKKSSLKVPKGKISPQK